MRAPLPLMAAALVVEPVFSIVRKLGGASTAPFLMVFLNYGQFRAQRLERRKFLMAFLEYGQIRGQRGSGGWETE